MKSVDELLILENGEQFFPRLCSDIDNSRKNVFLSTYIFRNDEIGSEIADKLLAANQRGVDVRVIVDGLGELVYPPRIGRKLRRMGIKFEKFNPIRLFPPSLHINMRNHRKIV
ncbi:MAG: phospholipase D-like domain-containing protein, partial [Coleofasciculus sp. C2-GNP5-27]